jgi:hypothetical protein
MTKKSSSILTRIDLWFSNLLFGRHEVPDFGYTARRGETRRVNFLEWLVWSFIGWALVGAIAFRIIYELSKLV